MGFKGFVNSDSGITLTQTYGVESLTSIQRFALLIKAGTDAIGAELAPEYIVSAVEFGLLDKADLDRANINRATALFKQGRFENPYLDYEQADVVRATNMETAHDQAYSLHLKATVLMKNHENTLPLSKDAGTKITSPPTPALVKTKRPSRRWPSCSCSRASPSARIWMMPMLCTSMCSPRRPSRQALPKPKAF